MYSHVVIIGRKYRQTPSGENDYYNITLTKNDEIMLTLIVSDNVFMSGTV